MRVRHRFEMCLLPRMHQTSNNRYNPNDYASLWVTAITCGLEAPKRHGKNTAFLSTSILLILPSVIINNKDLLKTRLIFNFYAQISCKNDWNNFLLLNTNAPLMMQSGLMLNSGFHRISTFLEIVFEGWNSVRSCL